MWGFWRGSELRVRDIKVLGFRFSFVVIREGLEGSGFRV